MRPELVVLATVEDRRLREQEVLPHVLPVVPALGLLLVHLVDEFLDFVRFMTSNSGSEAAWSGTWLTMCPLCLDTWPKQLRL